MRLLVLGQALLLARPSTPAAAAPFDDLGGGGGSSRLEPSRLVRLGIDEVDRPLAGLLLAGRGAAAAAVALGGLNSASVDGARAEGAGAGVGEPGAFVLAANGRRRGADEAEVSDGCGDECRGMGAVR